MGFIGDGDGVEVVAPEVALGVAESIDVAGVEALEVLHEAGDGAAPEGFEHEMDVVGHEAKGVNADFVAAGEEVEPLEVEEEVGGGVEGVLALGAALVDVEGLAAFPAAEAGRVGLGSAHALLNSGFSAGKFSFIFNLFLSMTCAKFVT